MSKLHSDSSPAGRVPRLARSRVLACLFGVVFCVAFVAACSDGTGPTAPPPAPTSISPTSGSNNGGTAVTIIGTGFASGATVTFGGTAATGVTAASATSITATTPARSTGAVDVVVTNPDGQSGRLANGFTYVSYQGSWSGTTSQSLPIAFTVSSDNVILTLRIDFTIQGSGCTATGWTSVATPLAISNGAFTFTNSTLALSGTFTSGSTASGTVTVTIQAIPGVPSCPGSTTRTWNATKS